MLQDLILILDLGGKENSRVARRIRALGVYSEIRAHDISREELLAVPNLKGIILCGGEWRRVDGVDVKEGDYVHSAGVPVLVIDHSSPFAPCDIATLPSPDDDASLDALLEEFVIGRCGARRNWNMDNFIADRIEELRSQIGDRKVLLALSGGVDSSVVAALLIRAIGDRLYCVHVNHGLMRKNESAAVIKVFGEQLGANLTYVDATERFLTKLENVADPEKKRKIIGKEFIEVFKDEAAKLDGISLLAQGTIYPDIVESGTKTGAPVKAHHNVGGLPEELGFQLVEPLKYLFKDEVRACGVKLGLPYEMVYRQPFPGPGLGVRCTGAITRDRLEALREADAILREEFAAAGLEGRIWQYFTVIPDMKSVGVKDGARFVGWSVIIRAVNTVDAMTAVPAFPGWELMQKITARILKEVGGVNRVLYDMTPKPPATIEFE